MRRNAPKSFDLVVIKRHLSRGFDCTHDKRTPHAGPGSGGGRNCAINRRISANNILDTATSANWNVTYRPWQTTLVPILTSFSRSVVSDQCSTSFGQASVRMKLPIGAVRQI